MGLPTGQHGVKELVKTRCAAAWTDHASLQSVRIAQSRNSNETVVILDGNVLVRQVPTVATTFELYTQIFNRFVNNALEAGDVVVVVFDEPALISGAKAAEQARRDRQSKKGAIVMSADLQECLAPKTDDYDYDVVTTANPHEIMRSRAARPRMFDAICKNTMNTLMLHSRAHTGKILVFDGIDARGASRPSGAPREAGMYSNDERAATLLSRPPDAPIVGEGDLKITDVESEIQRLRDTKTFFVDIELVIVCTIDTDSIAIELMHQSAKNATFEDTRSPPKTLLCFRETSRKRTSNNAFKDVHNVAAEAEPPTTRASFACVDVAQMHAAVVAQLGAPPGFHQHAVALLACAWCLGGCDFVHLVGMRSDVSFDAVADLCRSEKSNELLALMEPVWELRRDTDTDTVATLRNEILTPIAAVVEGARDRLKLMPRMNRAAVSINKLMEDPHAMRSTLLKAAWCGVYWSGLQCPNSQLPEWGF